MEKCLRKKSVRSFGRDLISECIETRDKDVIMRCSDGDIAFHRFYLGLISPVLKRVLSQCPYSAMSQVLVLMPQWTRSEVRRLKKLYQEDTVNRSKLLDTLAILSKDSGDGVNIRRAEAGSGQIEPFNQVDTRSRMSSSVDKRSSLVYEEPIQDLTNIESLDLFDPLYLEDVEIQNEENLSLTIHSNDLELMPPPTKKPKKIKSKPRKPSAATTDKDKENIESVGPDQELIQCVNCNKTFESEYLLDKHKKECKKKSATCSKCQQSFNKLSELKKHRVQHKGEIKGGVCQICNKKFKRQFHLQNHLRIHSGEKPYICHTCGKCFNQESTMKCHIRTHTGTKPHICTHCQLSFHTPSSLMAHTQWKHQDGERPFMCSFCSKSFPTKGGVRKHETIHKQEKKYSCGFCEKKFARPDHLKSHKRTHKNMAVLMLDVVTNDSPITVDHQ